MLLKPAFAIAAILLLATSCEPIEKSVRITISESGFDPATFEIEQGTKVVFENAGQQPHWPASNIHPTHRMYPESDSEFCGTDQSANSFDACRGLLPGDMYAFTFKHPGLWRFHDHLNPGLAGMVTVLGSELETGQMQFPEPTPRGYDDAIPENSPDIFQDDDALYSYVRKYGAAKTIQYLYELEDEFGDCHQTAHSAGRFTYELEQGQAFQTCSAECHSGCYHGATEAYFRDHGTTNLADDLAVICSDQLSEFVGHQCFHGVGHGLMAYSDYELFEALALCDLIPGWENSCYSGVFMENVVGGLAADQGHHTQYLSDDPHFPCNILTGNYRASCYEFQSSRMMQIFDGDFSAIADECAVVEDKYRRSCFVSMGRDVGGVNVNNVEGAIDDCNAAKPGDPRKWCLRGAVQNFFWVPEGQHEAIAFCTQLQVPEEKAECYDMIIVRAPSVIEDREALKAFCLNVEPHYVDSCMVEVEEA